VQHDHRRPDKNTFSTVATDFANPDKPVTHVHDGIGKLVAEWIWRDSSSEVFTIPGRAQTPASLAEEEHHSIPGVRVLFLILL
jgi:hypothetical protein